MMSLKSPAASVLQTWQRADCVCFDVDSTVCVDEGVDKLAVYCGVADEVKKLTNKAMNGDMTFEESFQARLELLRLTRQRLQQFVQENPPQLTPHIVELVQQLEHRGTHAHLVTGGIRDLVLPVLTVLGLPEDRLISNRLEFGPDGSYRGYDRACFTCRTGGKADAVRHLREARGYRCVVMVGDGVTDMEARAQCQLFVGFGGNVTRQQVKEGADWFVTDFACLAAALDLDVENQPKPASSD